MPCISASNEYPQHMFSWRNKKDIGSFWMKKAPYLLLWLLLFTAIDFGWHKSSPLSGGVDSAYSIYELYCTKLQIRGDIWYFSSFSTKTYVVDVLIEYRQHVFIFMEKRDLEVAGFTHAGSATFFRGDWSWNIFRWLFSLFCRFKKGSCQFLAKECAQYWLTAWRMKPAQ